MKEANRNYLAVGGFVLAMLAALLLWIAILSGSAGSTDRYHIMWDNVMGLKPGTQILYEGYQIGLIDKIQRSDADETKNYRVDIDVERGWPIPESAVAETTAPTFLAALVVNIDSGESDLLIQPGGEIEGKEQGDLLSAAGSVMTSVSEALEFMKPKLEEITTSVGLVLSEENAEQLRGMLQTINDRIEDVLSAENSQRIETILANLSNVSDDVAELTGGLRGTKVQIDDALGKVNGLIDSHSGDIGSSLVELRASLEAVSRHIDAITNNLEGATRNMNEFSGQIREDPSVLLRGREVGEGEGGS